MRDPVHNPELLDAPHFVDGPRVRLRRYEPGDGAQIYAALAPHREELAEWLVWPMTHQSPTDSESYVRRMHGRYVSCSDFPMGIWDKASGSFLGGGGFHAPDWSTPKAEFGYYLLPAARGQGYATEALRLLLDFGFRHLRLARVEGRCDVRNEASIAVMERVGLQREGLLRAECRDHHGALRDTLIYAAVAADWDADWDARR